MSDCIECGASIEAGEHFCGSCGAQQQPVSPQLKTVAGVIGADVDLPESAKPSPAEPNSVPASVEEPKTNDALRNDVRNAETDETPAPPASGSISSGSLGGVTTDPRIPVTSAAPRKGTTGGRQPTVNQLEGGTVLNSRYEIVRRIGGGGMGAVYLAKDRNLGDAPRAVKEMVEAHLDPSQHEKAIGDFKRESLLLTSLEHPSIPTIYDYFYDGSLGRFYLVMKFISGGDISSRLRTAPGGRIDERTVADWGMQAADVLEYLHSRPKPIIYRDLKPANLMIDG